MIIPLEPTLEGQAERRFLDIARKMLDHQVAGESDEIGDLVKTEASLARELRELDGQRDEYTACVRVLGDLAQLRWRLTESRYGLELRSPPPHEIGTHRLAKCKSARKQPERSCDRAFSNSSPIRMFASSLNG